MTQSDILVQEKFFTLSITKGNIFMSEFLCYLKIKQEYWSSLYLKMHFGVEK